jgi:hypothetical protein
VKGFTIMAKDKGTAATPAAGAAAPVAEKAATTKSGAAVVLASGQRRVDYIREQFKAGKKRGEIAKELGVAYQIVFAATKPAKAAPADAAAATPAQ